MTTKQIKPSVPLYYKIKDLLIFFVGGSLVGLAYFFFTDQYQNLIHWEGMCIATLNGAMIGISIFFAERFNKSSHLTRSAFITSQLLFVFIYGFIVLFWLTIFYTGPLVLKSNDILDAQPQKTFWTDFIFSILSAILFSIFMEVKSLLGNGFFIKYLTGRYHVQVEEERIFMFLDLQSSTSIAEQLGSENYSLMLRELFDDLTRPVLATRADIYQYVGDEVILTWTTRRGIRNNRCLHCFRFIEEFIAGKRDYYQGRFGVIPQFKASLHIGKAVSTIVGRVKKEIVYHGDVLNTTARMQSLCNHYKQKLIVSKELIDQLDITGFNSYPLGEMKLKGRTGLVELFGIRSV